MQRAGLGPGAAPQWWGAALTPLVSPKLTAGHHEARHPGPDSGRPGHGCGVRLRFPKSPGLSEGVGDPRGE